MRILNKILDVTGVDGKKIALISLDGGTTFVLPRYERVERERLTRLGKALSGLNPSKYDKFSRMVNHEQGDELLYSSGEPARTHTFAERDGNGRNHQPSLLTRGRRVIAKLQSLATTKTYIGKGVWRHSLELEDTIMGDTTGQGQGQKQKLTIEQIEQQVNASRQKLITEMTETCFNHLEGTIGNRTMWPEEFVAELKSQIGTLVSTGLIYHRSVLLQKVA